MKSKMLTPCVMILCMVLALAPAAAWAQNGKSPDAQKINLNTATSEQLQALPGVGPVLAKSIVDFREKNGKFKKIEEVLNVKGMGEKKFQRIKDRITI